MHRITLAAATVLLLAPAAPAAPAQAGDTESMTMSVRALKQIVDQQKEILADMAKAGSQLDQDSVRTQLQSVSHEYELLLRENPDFAAGYAAYGDFLRKVGMDKASLAILVKADQLDPKDPFVKEEIGDFLAEQGRPLDAYGYFRDAIQLDPQEPLYHYQLGTLLYEARGAFADSGNWTRDSILSASHDAFRRAAELAPDRVEFTYRYAESFYDLPKPDWDGALKAWAALEEKAQSPLERQTMRLQAANVLIKEGSFDRAKLLLSSVTDPGLQVQKQKLVAQLPENQKK